MATTTVDVLRIGGHAHRYLAAAPRTGSVASTFRHGFNVLFEEESAPTYVSVQTPAVPLHPWAIEVPMIPPDIAVDASVHVIDVAATASTQQTPRTELASLTIHTLRATSCDLRLAPWTKEQTAVALGRLPQLRTFADEESARRVPDPFQFHVDSIIAQWCAAPDPAALFALVGLGTGSTPSGDDLLVGILAGLTAMSALSAAGQELEALRQVLAGVSLRTHPASRQMLTAAADGAFPEPLLPLVSALGNARAAEELESAAVRVLALGASSGRGFLAGVLASLGRSRRSS
ncbi:MAG: DUF2877 domain-containing protein [Thermotogota bacterium]